MCWKGNEILLLSCYKVHILHGFNLKFTGLLLFTTYTRGKDTVDLDIFSRSQMSNFDLILGFVQFSTSLILWIIYTRDKETANLDLLSRSQGSNFLPPLTLFSHFLQGLCRHPIQILLDCCLGPPKVQKGKWLTLTYFHDHMSQERMQPEILLPTWEIPASLFTSPGLFFAICAHSVQTDNQCAGLHFREV